MKSAKKAENDPNPPKMSLTEWHHNKQIDRVGEEIYFSTQNDVIWSENNYDMWRKVYYWLKQLAQKYPFISSLPLFYTSGNSDYTEYLIQNCAFLYCIIYAF